MPTNLCRKYRLKLNELSGIEVIAILEDSFQYFSPITNISVPVLQILHDSAVTAAQSPNHRGNLSFRYAKSEQRGRLNCNNIPNPKP